MRCPYCGEEDSKVIDSRVTAEGKRRRRLCRNCSRRFTTVETVEKPLLMVAKRDGSLEPFNRRKLLAGIYTSLKKRPVRAEAVEAIVDEIEARLGAEGDATVSPDKIGTMVLERLRGLDQVAYVRFASVYMAFSDVEDFIRVIRDLQDGGDAP